MLVIGHIDYVNMIPLDVDIGGFEDRYCKVKATPAAVNQMLLEGKVDVGVISSAFYLENSDTLTRISHFGIIADGPAMSVLLFSDVNLENFESGKRLKLYETPHSKTSIIMNRIILSEFLEIDVENEKIRERADAWLLIGDEALIEREENKRFVYDIGVLWKRYTGLPAVFAVLATRKDFLRTCRKEVDEFVDLIEKNYRENILSLEKLALEGVAKTRLSIETMRMYFKNLKYEIGEAEEKSLEVFARLMNTCQSLTKG